METARLRVRLTPRAARSEIGEFRGETLHVRVTAPPVGGKANEALVRLVADRLRLPRDAVRIVAGHAAREKLLALDGIEVQEAHRRLQV
ncbi:MAG: DUF167 domain-containing protein [Dehalococcoidia bacterium]